MGKKGISFLILRDSGSPIKQINASGKIVRYALFFFAASLILSGYFAYDYITLKKASLNNRYLQSKLSVQQDEVTNQRKQIQFFAGEISNLKAKLVDLYNFEKKIRSIANIRNKKKNSLQEGLFGVGGSAPEDLDPKISLSEKHDSLMREMHEQVEELNVAVKAQTEGFKSIMTYFEEQRSLLASTPAIRPTQGSVTSTFGYRVSPFTGLREFHKGYDIASYHGAPIVATANGTVSLSEHNGLFGNIIAINHGHGLVTRYAHASKLLKKAGSFVKRGEIIALVGDTGRSTGPHVHYEVHLNGIPVNPDNYMLN
ncbi:MAG: M23 family metallopeptidase [Desulfobacterales bacterium]